MRARINFCDCLCISMQQEKENFNKFNIEKISLLNYNNACVHITVLLLPTFWLSS